MIDIINFVFEFFVNGIYSSGLCTGQTNDLDAFPHSNIIRNVMLLFHRI